MGGEVPDPDKVGERAEIMRLYRLRHPNATMGEIMEFDWKLEREQAEQELCAIRADCKGRPLKSLMALPAVMHAWKRLAIARRMT